MKSLLILRHAQAEAQPTGRDTDRPLTDKGARAARRLGRLLGGMPMQHVLCSTAERCLKTAKLALKETGYSGRVESLPELYLTSVEVHCARIAMVPPGVGALLVVGHNPTLEELVGHLTGIRVGLVPGALALVALPIAEWSEFSLCPNGMLMGVVSPSDLRKKGE